MSRVCLCWAWLLAMPTVLSFTADTRAIGGRGRSTFVASDVAEFRETATRDDPNAAARAVDERRRLEFEACTLPFEEWNHGMHVRVALNTLQTFGSAAGGARIVDGLTRYNAAAREEFKRDRKVKVSAASDHATITWFWIGAIRDRMRASDSFESFIARHPELGAFAYIFEFYAAEALYSPAYHDAFVPPPSKKQQRRERGGKKGGAAGKGKSRRR